MTNVTERRVPELSLQSFTHGNQEEKSRFTNELFTGLREFGFIVLKDHPISEDILNKAYSLSEHFFYSR